MEPKAAADNPEDALTESSEASSINLLIEATERKIPGSMGGGVAFPGSGVGKGGGDGRVLNVLRGESGGVWSLKLAKPRSLILGTRGLE